MQRANYSSKRSFRGQHQCSNACVNKYEKNYNPKTRILLKPFLNGWKRQFVDKNSLWMDKRVVYFTPCGKIVRSYNQVSRGKFENCEII